MKPLHPAPESTQFFEVLVALHQVSDRTSLVAWAESRLRTVIPFTSMACFLAEPCGRSFRIRDVISSGEVWDCLARLGADTTPTADDRPKLAVRKSTDTSDRLTQATLVLMNRWERERQALQMGTSSTAEQVGEIELEPLLACFDVDAVAVHGVKEAFSGSTTFFVIGTRPHRTPDHLVLRVLELLMPSVHVARQRIYRMERSQGSHRATVGLTPREVQILSLIAAGQTDEETAATMGRSVHTIKNQVRHLVTKLGARNRTQAVLMAHRHELVDND